MVRDAILGLAAALCAAVAPALAQDRTVLAVEPAAIVPFEAERELRVEGFAGELLLERGAPGELRVASDGARRGEPGGPVAIWTDGARIGVSAPEGEAGAKRRLRLRVPPGMSVVVALQGSSVRSDQLVGDLQVSGSDLDVQLASHEGSADVDAQRGLVSVVSLGGGGMSVRGTDLEVSLRQLTGRADLDLTGGTLTVDGVSSDVRAALQGTTAAFQNVQGPLQVRARRGQVRARAIDDAAFDLGEAPLLLEDASGEVDVDTDAELQFRDCRGALHVNSRGAAVRGSGHGGLVEVRTSGSEVTIEKVGGPIRVQGESLKLKLTGLEAEVVVYAVSSDVRIDDAKGPLVVENEDGAVEVHGVQESAELRVRGGTLVADGLGGKATVDADAESVSVGWSGMPGDVNVVKNEGGDVDVRVPDLPGIRVEASTRFGRAESSVPWIRTADGDTRAFGQLGQDARRLVQVEASGDIRVGRTGL
jgi:hypothetical protein